MGTFPRIAFFGTPDIAVWVLDVLEAHGIIPTLLITNPDAPQGRKMIRTPSPVARWGETRNISIYKPEKLNTPESFSILEQHHCELFIVTAYGKIIPEAMLVIPKFKTLNVHPSLLPQLRGASPIRTAILEDIRPIGVSIMLLTPRIDDGPILAQESIEIPTESWPIRGRELDELLAKKGGEMLVKVLPAWIAGTCIPQEQNHAQATFSKKITKDMGLINLEDDAYHNFLKIRAFDGWPGTYFFTTKNEHVIRVKIVDAEYKNGILVLTRVIPEGKKEMSYEDFLRG